MTLPGSWLARTARGLLAEPGVTLVAFVSLAIGIAANATIFSMVQAVTFPPFIYPDAGRIVFLESSDTARNLQGMPVSAPDATDLAAASRTLERASLTADQASVLRLEDRARRVSGRRVAPSFFAMLGIAPQLGRPLGDSDDGDRIVISDVLWRDAFGADAGVVGRAIRLDGGQVTVVGVMPPKFDADADFWTPLPASLATFARDDRQFALFARLALGVSLADATAELAGISARIARDHPDTNRNWTTMPVPLRHLHGRDAQRSFLILQTAVAVVLLIVCANIANILLARGTRRSHEMAVRLSLGATRRHLIRELLAESVLLAGAGGLAGVILALWGIRTARAIEGFPDAIEPTLNLYGLAFIAAVSMLTGILCGIVPALRASAVAPAIAMRADGGRGTTTRGRLRSMLVAVQLASAVVLVVSGALMVRTLVNRSHVDLGFTPDRAIRGDVAMFGGAYQDPAVLRARVSTVLDTLQESADIAHAGVIAFALPTGAGAQRSFMLPHEADRALAPSVPRGVEAVSPGYFEAIGVPLRRGRTVLASDTVGAEPVTVVNEELARHLWPDVDPIGQPLRLGSPGDGPVVTVVGVVGSVRRSAMHDRVVARAYLPYGQFPSGLVTYVVRARTDDTSGASRALEAAVQRVDPSLLVERLQSVSSDIAQFVAPIRLVTTLLAGFGIVGLLLAMLGVFGTMSYTVSQRERELAVRAVLGANRRDLLLLVLRGGLVLTIAGLVPGLLLAGYAARALSSYLFGVTPGDPITLGFAAASIGLVALVAAWRPARRAATVDPMTVLRRS